MGSELRPITLPADVRGPEARLGLGLNGLHVMNHDRVYDGRSKEQHWHRVAANLFAMGKSDIEVADFLELSPATVSGVKRNPAFIELLNDAIQSSSADVMAQVKSGAVKAVTALHNLLDDPKTSPTLKAKISFEFLNHHIGKPTQKIEVTGSPISADPVEEAERLEAETARLLGG